jgi:phenylpropionate dioxygenase-like ring-hydroxylating dioxygenase large terminal subunit
VTATTERAEAYSPTPPKLGAVPPDLPALGFRNYWYPIISSGKVRNRPVSVRLLGEDLVLFRSAGKVTALYDRCPHRGARLSLGKTIFPGTLSCGYHGWTFDRDGRCVAVLVEGPRSKVPGTVRVHRYPTEERLGIVWAYMGAGEPPLLEEDLPPEALSAEVPPLFFFEEWNCDWRTISENVIDSAHPMMVHRNSLMSFFQKVPVAAERFFTEIPPDGKSIIAKSADTCTATEFPGLGSYPKRAWWRLIGPKRRPRRGQEMRMPGYNILYRQDPYLGTHTIEWQWPVPIDAGRSRLLIFSLIHPRGSLHRAMATLWWHLWWKHVRRQFVHQDRRQLEPQTYRNPERLSAGDAGVVGFRRFAAEHARQPRAASPSSP